MAPEAGDAVLHHARGAADVAHDGGIGHRHLLAHGVHQHVALHAVRHGEDHLAGVVLEGVHEPLLIDGPRPERIGEDILAADVGLEVVAHPEVLASSAQVALGHPVVQRDARAAHREADHVVRLGLARVVDVVGDVDAEASGQVVEGVRRVGHDVVERSAAGGVEHPVGAHEGRLGVELLVERLVAGHVGGQAVGIEAGELIPERVVPAQIGQPHAEDGARRIDGHHRHDGPAPRQRVDQEAEHVLGQRHLLGRTAEIGEVGQAEVAEVRGE